MKKTLYLDSSVDKRTHTNSFMMLLFSGLLWGLQDALERSSLDTGRPTGQETLGNEEEAV